jgi:hypothetical protein
MKLEETTRILFDLGVEFVVIGGKLPRATQQASSNADLAAS